LPRSKEGDQVNERALEISSGITLFKGNIARNLIVEPMACNAYFLEDGDEVIIFDPSCGKELAGRIEAHIRRRRASQAQWKRAFVIAGHSHMDHANNFYLGEVIGAQETHACVHEQGFRDGKVMNEPKLLINRTIEEFKKYFNPYMVFPFPYNLLMYPFAAMDAFSPAIARELFSTIGAIPWPRPKNGAVRPKPLREDEMEVIELGDTQVNGWRVDGKIIFPTPGHSPCSVSLFWPEKKALFISDADWLGNPLFISSSLRDCISSLQKMRQLTEAGEVELLLPAHGQVRQGSEMILSHLDFHLALLETLRNEVLSAYRSYGEEKDVHTLTGIVTRESPLFRMLRLINYPRFLVFRHTVVAVCLREEGILP
jgi:glyoxylase-like metal-dependent hydrolase (beta-lactamase superfamily II)